ncbi:MAG TPA: TonB-dependent siderophore receptor, partial [Gemmatimonadaceae bacterium]|nr:TonB-dependent siderophore receptor [Gemmatimonadaceae bacterium]
REVLADQSVQSMADVVRYMPGITMGLGEGHRDQPTIRGNSSTADFFVDGVRDDAQYLRDVYNAERIEALKGPNAMAFGRGGGGGVLNRVTKTASWSPTRTLSVEGGSFDHGRGTLDVGGGFGEHVAARLNGMMEHSGGFRDRSDVRRHGVNPTATILAGAGTQLQLGYEHFVDERTVDRGIPSWQGAPSPAAPTTFFGDPSVSRAHALVQGANVLVQREMGNVTLRNVTRGVHYDKFYQNVLPGTVNTAGTEVNLTGYNNATDRASLFNQTDLTTTIFTGATRHTLLAGGELSRQRTDNLRQTGYFGTSTSLAVPFDQPTQITAVSFRQSATDANNHSVATVGALYLQDQVELSPRWQAVAGVRVDRFAIRFHNNRTDEDLSRHDQLVSPRGGLIFKPVEPMSIYASYAVSQLPSAGDQFSSLTATSETLRPERFDNYELGAKWDATTALSLSGALYRLDRSNSAAHDPLDATRTVQTGAQRTTGWELGISGRLADHWDVVGGVASQRAEIVHATTAAPAGAAVPLVPRVTASLWNKVEVSPALGAGLGIVRQGAMFAAIDNSVTLPAFTRTDGALFLTLPANLKAQLNVENLFGTRYYATAQGNNNILPGAGRTIRFSVAAGW